MSFRITGLDPRPYASLWGAGEDLLSARGILRFRADSNPGFPDRITLDDALVGRDVLLMNHVSQSADTPYRASHAVFVLEGADTRFDATDTLPPAMLRRPQSLRAFDAAGMMRDADIADGPEIATAIQRLFEASAVTEIHAHNARQGCFMARITRA